MGRVQLPLDEEASPSLVSRFILPSKILIPLGLVATALSLFLPGLPEPLTPYQLERYDDAISRCQAFTIRPGPTKAFFEREVSDRFDAGTKPVLIVNGTIWTGGDGGKEVLYESDVCLAGGLIKGIGTGAREVCERLKDKAKVIDAHGAWVTPGIIDMHSHIGLLQSPGLNGAADVNAKLPIGSHPWFRSIDGLNTHDPAYRLTIAGGTTSSLVLVGSAHSINGESYAIKHRETKERTPDSFVIERGMMGKGRQGNVTAQGKGQRYIKFAMGENPSGTLKQSRPESVHVIRQAFHSATRIKQAQDGFCDTLLSEHDKSGIHKAKAYAKLKSNGVDLAGPFPGDETEQWDLGVLVDVLRGDVRVNTHCYEATDLATFLALGHEFGFETTAFHHAHEAYIVPELLKTAWGSTPAVSIFVLFANYKREAWRGSKFASAVLEDAGIEVILKSDHNAIDSGSLNFQAGMAHHYGLSLEAAMNAITTIPARRMGLSHRIGALKLGYDADLVIWDAHPLSLGARPREVIVDGIPQINLPGSAHTIPAPAPPRNANFSWYIDQAQRLGGEASELTGVRTVIDKGSITFVNVTTLYRRDPAGSGLLTQDLRGGSLVIAKDGEMQCMGKCDSEGTIIDLKGGTITPGLISVGSELGLGDIAAEVSTTEGPVVPLDLAASKLPLTTSPARTLLFASKDMMQARQVGVSRALTWAHGDTYKGLSTHFATNAKHALSPGAIIDDNVALHFAIGHQEGEVSVAQQLASLQRLLEAGLKSAGNATTEASPGERLLAAAALGHRPLAIQVASAEYMAALILLKADIEALGGSPNIVFLGAIEGHRLAQEIAAASIPVILPQMTYPSVWEYRNVLAGKPLELSLLSVLLDAGVRVAIGSSFAEQAAPSGWMSSQLLFDLGRYRQQAASAISPAKALAMLTTDLEDIFNLTQSSGNDYIAWEGNPLEFGAKVRAISQNGTGIEVFW